MSAVEADDPKNDQEPNTLAEVRELVGPATPHFSLHLRDRVQAVIFGLPAGDPVRAVGADAIASLECLAVEGRRRPCRGPLDPAMPSLASPDGADQ